MRRSIAAHIAVLDRFCTGTRTDQPRVAVPNVAKQLLRAMSQPAVRLCWDDGGMTTTTIQNERHMETVLAKVREEMLAGGIRDGRKFVMSVKTETRGVKENAHFHSLIAQIAEQSLIGGHKFSPEDAKRILTSAFRFDTKDDVDLAPEWAKFGELRLVPALNHEGLVALGEQTRQFSVKLARAFCIWLDSYGQDNGVVFMAPKSWEEQR